MSNSDTALWVVPLTAALILILLILAIKLQRESSGMGLKEAKDF